MLMTILFTLAVSAFIASMTINTRKEIEGTGFWDDFFIALFIIPGPFIFILSLGLASGLVVDTTLQSMEIKQYKLLPIAIEKPNVYVFRTDSLDPKEIKYEFKYKENNEFLTNGVLISESVVYFDSKPGEAYISKMEAREVRTSKISEMLLSSSYDDANLLVFHYYEIHLPPEHTEV